MNITEARATRSWVPPLVVVATSLIILGVMNPQLLFEASTPAGGDMGAHVYAPDYLRDVLLPEGRVQGWSQEWFAGFPIFYFYFPLPSLVIVLLDLLLPYGVAFKLATVAGLVGLAPAVYFMTRSMDFPAAVAAIAAAGSAAFAFMESFSIYGGNVASTLAGEFAFSWSFTLGFVYLGLLVRAVRGERHLIPWAALVFGLAALSHVLTLIVLVLASLFVLRRPGALETAIPIWVWAASLTAFWSLPFVVRIRYSTDMAWTPLSRWEEVFPIELWLLLPVGVAGAVWALRRTSDVRPMLAATLIPVIYYPLPVMLRALVPDLVGEARFKLWNGRLLPYWYFGVIFFAALGLGAFVMWFSRRVPSRVSPWWVRAVVAAIGGLGLALVLNTEGAPRWVPAVVGVTTLMLIGSTFGFPDRIPTRSVLAGTGAAVVALGALAGVTFVDGWARWNYSGYEGKDSFGEYQSLMATIDGLAPGRVQWEYNTDLNRYGTTMSLMLIPFWTDSEHPSMEGLFFESSLTVPFHFLNQAETSHAPSRPVPGLNYYTFNFERGIPHLALYGVRYYAAFTEEAKEMAASDPRLTLVAESPPWEIYEIVGVQVIEPVTRTVSVYEGAQSFGEFALDWYGELDKLDQLVVADGPDHWPRVSSLDELDAAPVSAGGEVTDVVLEDHRISFRTTAVGIPHLVKVSYFPNWTARGAEGPYYSTPSLMVVVPTDEHVVLEFERTWVEWLGLAVTAGALLFWIGAVIRQRTTVTSP